ncbi:MAG: TauD/TfdA family dioxygenase [Candidatus Thiodiazotropha taylori]|nr:TauD/TfdA family dioxygenase [Candidatus Thiodiazotropha taylori]
MDDVESIAKKIRFEGYAFINEWQPSLNTEEVASEVGSILDVEKYLPNAGIGKIQRLNPKEPSKELINQYSGSYGLDEFPFHSDLAHWQIPPRYLLLRCIRGYKDVLTNLLPLSVFEKIIEKKYLKFALVYPRRKSGVQTICPMSIKFKTSGDVGVRWDLLFLQPLNAPAREAYKIMLSAPWDEKEIIPACLEKPGDTLIIDNWKMLHNRTTVPFSSQNREIERVYLNSIG